jgi:hypothetical protein
MEPMSAPFDEDFLQTIIGVSWPSLSLQFQFTISGGWHNVAALLSGGVFDQVSIPSPSSRLSAKYSQSKIRTITPGKAVVGVTIQNADAVIAVTAVLASLLDAKGNMITNAQSAMFDPNQVPNPPFTTNFLTVDFVKRTLSWKYT